MTRMKYLFTFLVCMFVFPMVSNAECGYERQAELSRIASNVQFSYSYEKSEVVDQALFQVFITNLTNDIYIVDSYGNRIFGNTEKQMNYFGFQGVNFTIYSNDPACFEQKILVSYLELPVYNKYYQSDICVENRDNDLCALWRDNSVYSSSTFEKMVNQSKKTKNVVNDVDDDNSLIVEFLQENITSILISFGSILLLIFLLIIKRRIRG